MIRRWWAQKYKLPANDERFTRRSLVAHFQELLEDLIIRRDELREELRSAPGVRVSQIHEELATLKTVITGVTSDEASSTQLASTGDAEYDAWEEAVLNGDDLAVPEFAKHRAKVK